MNFPDDCCQKRGVVDIVSGGVPFLLTTATDTLVSDAITESGKLATPVVSIQGAPSAATICKFRTVRAVLLIAITAGCVAGSALKA